MHEWRRYDATEPGISWSVLSHVSDFDMKMSWWQRMEILTYTDCIRSGFHIIQSKRLRRKLYLLRLLCKVYEGKYREHWRICIERSAQSSEEIASFVLLLLLTIVKSIMICRSNHWYLYLRRRRGRLSACYRIASSISVASTYSTFKSWLASRDTKPTGSPGCFSTYSCSIRCVRHNFLRISVLRELRRNVIQSRLSWTAAMVILAVQQCDYWTVGSHLFYAKK